MHLVNIFYLTKYWENVYEVVKYRNKIESEIKQNRRLLMRARDSGDWNLLTYEKQGFRQYKAIEKGVNFLRKFTPFSMASRKLRFLYDNIK